MQARTTLTISSWEEQVYAGMDAGGKLARAQVEIEAKGDLEGDISAEYLLVYAPDGTGSYVGTLWLTGSIDGRSGECVLLLQGTFDGTAADGAWSVAPNSGTDELLGLTGTGGFPLTKGTTIHAALEYSL